MDIYNKKREMRKNILKIRDGIDAGKKQKFDDIIKNEFFNSSYYKNSKKIFIYISYKSEIDTVSIIKRAIEDNKEIYVPRTEFETKLMDAVKIESLDNLKEDKYGILEPSKEEPSIDPNELDLIVVPGLGFDLKGNRLGYGAGYYDRYFKRINKKGIKKIALAYNFQIIDDVPIGRFDEKIDLLITEEKTIEQ